MKTPPTAKGLPEPSDVFRVGTGEPCDPLTRVQVLVCPRDGYQITVPRTCEDERGCPVCSRAWARREAVEAAHRLRGVQRLHGLGRSLRHVVVSFDKSTSCSTGAEWSALFGHAWDVLRRMGSLGGALVVHGERHPCAAEEEYEWHPGAHVHALVWGRVDADLRPGGVVVRTLRYAQATVGGTLAYLLDHCSVVRKGHAVHYFGVATYNKSPGLEKLEPVEFRCQLCGGPLEPLEGLVDYTSWPSERVGRGPPTSLGR